MTDSPPITFLPAAALGREELRGLFNAGYEGYFVPLEMSEEDFAGHLADNDIDLDLSRVARDDRPASFALIGRRGSEAWVGGMGTVLARRRLGYGERVLSAALDAGGRAGIETVWLEVIDANHAARALYEKLGFTAERELAVWSIGPDVGPSASFRASDPPPALAWIAAHRRHREAWQRADATVASMRARGLAIGAGVIERGEAVVAAAVYAEAAAIVTALQFAAVDEAAAVDALRGVSAATDHKRVILANYPADEILGPALAELGARLEVAQVEMRAQVG